LTNIEVSKKYVQPADDVNVPDNPFQTSTHQKYGKSLDFQQNPNLNSWPKYKNCCLSFSLNKVSWFLEFD